MEQKFPPHLLKLITHLKKLPGVGTRTAERFAFELLNWDSPSLEAFSESIKELKENVPFCPSCGCLCSKEFCMFCNQRDPRSLCLLANAKDAFAIEQTGQFKGLYHVIEHLLSPLDGRHSETLNLEKIRKRIEVEGVKELILAFDSTIEGDTTALYLKTHLAQPELSISRLAFGIPVGSSLDYIDGGTLARALSGRQSI